MIETALSVLRTRIGLALGSRPVRRRLLSPIAARICTVWHLPHRFCKYRGADETLPIGQSWSLFS